MTETIILRTRPTTVEARQLTRDPDNREELSRWVGGWTYGMSMIRWFDSESGRVMEAQFDDWLIKTAFGHYKPVPDRVLLSQFDRITTVVSE